MTDARSVLKTPLGQVSTRPKAGSTSRWSDRLLINVFIAAGTTAFRPRAMARAIWTVDYYAKRLSLRSVAEFLPSLRRTQALVPNEFGFQFAEYLFKTAVSGGRLESMDKRRAAF